MSDWPETRRLVLDGRVVISQTPTDPGDIGEPRISEVDDVTYVSVPEFELWPTDPDWEVTDASVVFVTKRSLVSHAVGRVAYHLSRPWTYGSVTRCGRIIWASDGRDIDLLPIRRDLAARIGRPCGVCGAEAGR